LQPTPTRPWLARLEPRLILWGGAILALSLLVSLSVGAALLWRDGRQDAEDEVRRLVRLLGQHAAQTVEPVDRALLELQWALEQVDFGRTPLSAERLRGLLSGRAKVGRQLQRLAIVDAQGRILAASDQPTVDAGLRVDDAWFAALAAAPPAGLAVQPQRVSRFVPMRVVPMVRAMIDPATGAFLGAVVGAVDAAEIEAFHASLRLGPDWRIELLRADGVALGSGQPWDRWAALVAQLPAGTEERVHWYQDAGGEWITGLHRAAHWPLVAAVAVRSEAIVTPWRQHAMAIASVAAPAALTLLGLAWLGTRAVQRARGLSRTLGITEARYRSLVESSPDGILLSREGRIDYANGAMLQLASAASGSALVGRRVDELLDGVGEYHRSTEFDGPPQPTVVRLEHTLRPLGGAAPRDVETLVAAAPQHEGGEGEGERDAELQIVVRDISARKAAERALRESEERHRLMVEGAPDCAFLLLDGGGRIETLGASARDGVLGPPAHWHGRPLAALLDDEGSADGHAQRLLAAAAGSGGHAEHDGWCRRAGGDRFWGELVVSALHDEQGAVRGYHVQVRDATARRRLQRELVVRRREVEGLAMAAENAREREKRRIARELHDELGQVLTVQQLELEMLSAEAAGRWPELMPRIEGLHARVDDAIGVTRRISGDLRPLVLDDLGLVAALEWLVDQIGSRGGLKGRLSVHGDPTRISDEVATTLFRIAQESVTNVLRHAEASQVLIELAIDPERGENGAAAGSTDLGEAGGLDKDGVDKDGVVLRVVDDGRGIEPRGARRRGLGLRGIEERVRLLGGRFELATPEGGGTRVQVRLPLAEAPAEPIDTASQDL